MPKPKTIANDNSAPSTNAISLSDMAILSGIDEDTLLRRMAGILNRRGEKDDADA